MKFRIEKYKKKKTKNIHTPNIERISLFGNTLAMSVYFLFYHSRSFEYV